MKSKNWQKLKPWQKGKIIGLALGIIWAVGGMASTVFCNHRIGISLLCNLPVFSIFGAPFIIFQIISSIPYLLFNDLFSSAANTYLEIFIAFLILLVIPAILTLVIFTIIGFVIGKIISKIKPGKK